ncbi:PTS sugar transporter subunit IIA [Candidatus Enterococcus ferrettii]|uniref:PTS EIIA type-2 domain-containing protein n=1 Tax=Candidatus Enterococcus ferrettii TaxID=2815324 RepID=A0ABV0EJX5_9ENTE|nr:PTS sugar transporter subunit IIA [Enterococcus sp. 665A]MBO1338277.1 PTS sugar transporter subunit IIA [Enterococcus sp. 665A]
MIITKKMIHPELVAIHEKATNFSGLVDFVSQKLSQLNFIQDSYPKAIKEREKEYPTGLETPTFAVAIPHTDPTHIKEPFIYIVKLQQEVSFGQMGTTEEFIQAKYAFFLGFDKGEDQLQLLQTLMAMFTNSEVMSALESETNEAKILEIVTNFFE